MAKHKDSKETWLCKSCGCNLLRRPQEYRKGDCGKCFQAKKKQAASDLLLRPCKTCGKPIGSKDKRQVVCSKRCGHDGRSQGKVLIECAVCGKQVERYARQASKFKVACCSLECQRQHALNENHSSKTRKDWSKSQVKARKDWRIKQQRERQGKNTWFVAAKKSLKKVLGRHLPDFDSWEYRVGLRIATHKGRSSSKPVTPKHSRTIEQALRKVRARRKQFERSDWHKSVATKLSSHKSRRRAKHERSRKNIESVASGRQDSSQWSQVCFEWMGN